MSSQRWLLRGLIILNVLVLFVVVADWRRQEVAQMEQALTQRMASPEPKIRLAEPVSPIEGALALESSQGRLDSSDPRRASADASMLSSGAAVTGETSSAPTPKAPSQSCRVFGPLSADHYNAMRSTIDSFSGALWYQVGPKGALVVGDEPRSHRVYVPPSASYEEAYDLLEVFRAQGFDSYVMTEGPYARGISLGVFSSDLAAENLLDQFGPRLKSLIKVGEANPSQQDFMLQVSSASALETRLLADLLPKGVNPEGENCSGFPNRNES